MFRGSKRELSINVLAIFVMLAFIVLTCVLENTAVLLMSPVTTAVEFLESMPYFTVSGVVIQQISSMIMVWALGFLIVACGVVVLLKKRNSNAGRYWGIGLILWGLGAIVAGVSYQSFGYELKAKGNEFVLFTSDWELSYMILTAFATNYMLVGTAFATLPSEKVKPVVIFACCHAFAYGVYMLFGSIFAIEFVISYFGFVVFVAIDFLFMLIFNFAHYKKHGDGWNKHMIFTWIDFAIVNISYFVCYYAGMGGYLYSNFGIWFNENDVLHLLLMVWAVHVCHVHLKYLPNKR